MSKHDLLSPDEHRVAEAQGWSLSHVFDLATSKWSVMVLGLPNAEVAGQAVVMRARTGDPVSTKALRLVMASHQGTT